MYEIVRFFFFTTHEKEVIKTGLTLEEARLHCKDPESCSTSCVSDTSKNITEKYGAWFDGYREM
jgi:hypothetical protein